MKADYLKESGDYLAEGIMQRFPDDEEYSYRVDREQTVKFWILVTSEEDKQKLIEESQYLHDELEEIDSDKANHLMHIYENPEIILIGEIDDLPDEEDIKLNN